VERQPDVDAEPAKSGAHGASPHAEWQLRLYIAGMTAGSARAVRAVKAICEEHLKDDYELEVFDVFQDHALDTRDNMNVAPALWRMHPRPQIRVLGSFEDLGEVARLLGVLAKEN
jgi:circadian clock protein KaiB